MAAGMNTSTIEWHDLGAADLSALIEQAMARPFHRERWKYTRMHKVAELLHAPAATGDDDSALIEPDTAINLTEQIASAPEALAPFIQGHRLRLIEAEEDGAEISLSNHATPTYLRVHPGISVSLIQVASSIQSSFLWLDVMQGASCELSINALSGLSHRDYLHAQVGENADFVLNLHTQGAPLARQDIQIKCIEPGANVAIHAAACISPEANLDQQITIEHRAPKTSSRQYIHNVAGQNASVTFNGRIHIYENCPEVDAHLSNKNIALASQASFNTKPELEIYTDDVVCSHGATVGALDEGELFYCLSRGIDLPEARRLLSMAFLNRASHGPLSEAAFRYFRASIQ